MIANNQNLVKPYGDRKNDGMMQLSFTLPVMAGDEARQAAVEYAEKLGLTKIMVAHMEAMDQNFTFFVVYASSPFEIDFSQIKVVKRENPVLSYDAVNHLIQNEIKRKLVVVGACIGSDAHTVGIDAIFNMKGYDHDWGLERYPWLKAHNLRAQVSVADLVEKVWELHADAVLISRVVTQRDEHIVELKKFLEVLAAKPNMNPQLIKICGGPRITHQEALSWGYAAGFGPGTKPSEVASFIVHEFIKKTKTS